MQVSLLYYVYLEDMMVKPTLHASTVAETTDAEMQNY